MQKKVGLVILILALLPAALFAAGFFSPRVTGRVTVGGVSIYGCTKKQAQKKLAGQLGELTERTLTFVDEGDGIQGDHKKTFPLPREFLDCRTNFNEVFYRALAAKKGERVELFLTARYRLKHFPTFAEELAKALKREAKNAEMRFLPQTPPYFFYTQEEEGRAVDEYALLLSATAACEKLSSLSLAAACEQLSSPSLAAACEQPTFTPHDENQNDALCKENDALLSGENSTPLSRTEITVTIPFRTLPPAVTVAALKNATRPLGCYSTDFSASPPNRKHNVRLAAEKLSGAIILPSAELSFNQTVGARTLKNGFLPATVIAGGRYESGIGGGVCQASTTLYNAALLSGLTVTEWHPHSLAVSYVPPARDAMVSYGTADLKIKNVGNTPVYLVAECKNDRLAFTFYGTPSGKTFALFSEEVETLDPPPPMREWDTAGLFPTLKRGEEKTVQRAAQGMHAACYLEITEGKTTYRVLLRKSTYQPVQERIIIGMG